jgi:hypothetical protein
MLKLTEENLANWPQMSQEDRVDLIQTKLEVEADAQKILLKEGGPNVNRAMAQEHLTNIKEKLGGLDKATQAGRVPEWVDRAEAPRLFSKEGEGSSKSVGTVQGGDVEPSHSGTMQVDTNVPKGDVPVVRNFAKGSEPNLSVNAGQGNCTTLILWDSSRYPLNLRKRQAFA